jgi:hypothetical protein
MQSMVPVRKPYIGVSNEQKAAFLLSSNANHSLVFVRSNHGSE